MESGATTLPFYNIRPTGGAGSHGPRVVDGDRLPSAPVKITARVLIEDKKIALDCKPLFGALYTVYASFTPINGETNAGDAIGIWYLPSGRPVTSRMLDAIDRLPGITMRARARATAERAPAPSPTIDPQPDRGIVRL